jgi:hypothetical protein
MSEIKVVALRGDRTAQIYRPDAALVAALEKLLERAKTGELTGIAYAYVTVDGRMGTSWHGGTAVEKMAATLGLLHHRFFAAWRTSVEDDAS